MADAKEVAAGLTKEGRECLSWVRPHSSIALYRKGAAEIETLGLVTRFGRWFDITPLGLEVRAILEQENRDV